MGTVPEPPSPQRDAEYRLGSRATLRASPAGVPPWEPGEGPGGLLTSEDRPQRLDDAPADGCQAGPIEAAETLLCWPRR